ncbi:unnamed protein product [Staurois parvus]|uniref:Uncharacterized protein n=1 Tax=Staurois parvus TaxID=386267 RepID=A0ABN9ENX9_9NEOB|nr:unnamed protein product [Staurois parvus]
MLVPKAVTPSYTRAYHAELHRESLHGLPCPSLPAMCPLQRPRPSPLMPASGFCVPAPVTSGRTAPPGNLKVLKNFIFFQNTFFIVKHCCFNPFHIHFVPSALSDALPAFLLFFLPGN